MKALSVKHPWAELIASGKKTIETRVWDTDYRGNLLIVSSLRPDMNTMIAFGLQMEDLVFGQALCIVTLTDCRAMTREDEKAAMCEVYPNAKAWILENLRPIKPFSVRGALGIYDVPLPLSVAADLSKEKYGFHRPRRRCI